MNSVTTSEAQLQLPQLLARVALGEEVVITDGGLPVARLSQPDLHRQPFPAPRELPAVQADADEEDDRPWRGVFAIERPGEPYPGVPLQLLLTAETLALGAGLLTPPLQ